MDYYAASKAHFLLAEKLGDSSAATDIITDRMRLGALPAKAWIAKTNGESKFDVPLDLTGASRSAAIQWRWISGDLRVTAWHWQIGEYTALEAMGVELEKQAIDRLISSIETPVSKRTHVEPLSPDGLPDEWARLIPQFTKDVACAAWWDWTEACSWVRTRSLEDLGSQRAWREHIQSEEGRVTPSLLLALRGVGDEQAQAEHELMAAVLAERVLSHGLRNSDGADMDIPATAWHEARVKYPEGRTALGSKRDYLSYSYVDLLFRRDDLQRAFPGPAAPSAPANGEQAAETMGDLIAPIHPRYIGGPQVQDMPAVHRMAELLRAKEAKSINKAATKVVETNDEEAKAFRLSGVTTSAVKRISEIYRMHYDDEGYPYGYSGPRPA